MNEFLKFDKMITPSIIKFVWWITSGILVIYGLIIVMQAVTYGGGGMAILGLIIIFTGPFAARIYCELLIVMFKIYENLQAIRAELASKKNEL